MGFYLAMAGSLALAIAVALPIAIWLKVAVVAALVIVFAWAARKILKPKPATRPAGQAEPQLEPMRNLAPKPEPVQSWISPAEALKQEMELAREERYRQQFPEVLRLIVSAEGYPAAKQAMKTVLTQYPHFAEAARHMQIVGESLSIIEKTQNRATLESRIAVIQENETAMYQALPFHVDADARAARAAAIDALLQEGLERIQKAPLKAVSEASARRLSMRERRDQMLLNTDSRPLWQLRAVGDGDDPKGCAGLAFPVYRWDDPFWEKNSPWVCRKKNCRCSVRAYRLDETPMLPSDR